MNTEDLSRKSSLKKRKAETDTEDLKDDFDTIKTMCIKSDEALNDNSKSNEVDNAKFIDEALKTLEDLRRNLNTNCNDLESPDTSDCEFDDVNNECNQEMLENANFLGYTACIQETFRFLDECGIPESDPLYEQLKKHFIKSSHHIFQE